MGQDSLRAWLQNHGLKHAWCARRLGYTPEYFSRVLSGRDALTDEFRRRCRDVLGVPEDVFKT